MQLDKRQREERARRRGATGRTLLMVFWLAICFAAAYVVTEWLFNAGLFTPAMVYRAGVPATVPVWLIQGVLMIVLVLVMQFFVILGFLVASPRGRRRLGRPTLPTSQEFDDDRYS